MWLWLDLKKQKNKKTLPHDKVFKLYVNSNRCVNKITILPLKRLLKIFLLGSCQRVCRHSQGKRGSTHCIFFWHAWPWISSRLSWQMFNSVNSCSHAPHRLGYLEFGVVESPLPSGSLCSRLWIYFATVLFKLILLHDNNIGLWRVIRHLFTCLNYFSSVVECSAQQLYLQTEMACPKYKLTRQH